MTDVINYNCDGSSGLGFVSKTSEDVTLGSRDVQYINASNESAILNAVISRNKGYIQIETLNIATIATQWNMFFSNYDDVDDWTFLFGHSAWPTINDYLTLQINTSGGAVLASWDCTDVSAIRDTTLWHTFTVEWDRENVIPDSDGSYIALSVDGVKITTYHTKCTAGWVAQTDVAMNYYLGDIPGGGWNPDRYFDNLLIGDVAPAYVSPPNSYDLTGILTGFAGNWTVDDWATTHVSGDVLTLEEGTYTIKRSADIYNIYITPADETFTLSADVTKTGVYVAYPDTQVNITASGVVSGNRYFTVDSVESDDYTEYLVGATHTIKSGPRQIRFVPDQDASSPLTLYNYEMLPDVVNEITVSYLSNSPLVVQSPIIEVSETGNYDIFVTSMYWGRHTISTDDYHIVIYTKMVGTDAYAGVVIYDNNFNVVKNAVIGSIIPDTPHDRSSGHVDNNGFLFIQANTENWKSTYALTDPDFFTSAIDVIDAAIELPAVEGYGIAYATDSNNKTHVFESGSSAAAGFLDGAVYVGETSAGSGVHRFLISTLEFDGTNYLYGFTEVQYTTSTDSYLYYDINGSTISGIVDATILPFSSPGGIAHFLCMKSNGDFYGVCPGTRTDTLDTGLWYWIYNGSTYSFVEVENSLFTQQYCYSDAVNDPFDDYQVVDLTVQDATYEEVKVLSSLKGHEVSDDVIVIATSSYCIHQRRGFAVSYVTNNGGTTWQRISQIPDANFGDISKPNASGKFMFATQSIEDPKYSIIGIPMQLDLTGTIGSITVDISGGDGTETWSPDGGTTNLTDLGSVNLEAGQYLLTFNAVVGFETPYPISVDLSAGAIRKEYATYISGDYGDLTIIANSIPVGVDARFTLDNGATYHTAGKIKVAPGTYDIEFEDITGLPTPATIDNVVIASGSDLTYTVAFANAVDITSSAGSNGSISPTGIISVSISADQTFTITPDFGYHINDVLVDGMSVGAVSSYEFTNVTANHTISVTFVSDTASTETLTLDSNWPAGAEVVINGITYTEDTVIELTAGNYSAIPNSVNGYTNNGSQQFTIVIGTPVTVTITYTAQTAPIDPPTETACFSMADYLDAKDPDCELVLNINPSDVIPLTPQKNQELIYTDDPSEIVAISYSDITAFIIQLLWKHLTAAESKTIVDFWVDPAKANGIARTFYWRNVEDGETYVVRMLSEITHKYYSNMQCEVAGLTLLVEGKYVA